MTHAPLQVDLRWDFTHARGGLAAAKLAADAAWNLCPVGNALHGTACYFDQDRTFPSVTGSESLEINDLPAGSWRVVVKRDYFRKVAGAVRNRSALAAYGNGVVKIEVAHLAAMAGLEYEAALLQVRDAQLVTLPARHADVAAACMPLEEVWRAGGSGEASAPPWALVQAAIEVAGADFEALVTQQIEAASGARLRAVEASANNTAVYPDAASFQAALDAEAAVRGKLLDNLQARSIAACEVALSPLNAVEQAVYEGAPLLPPLRAWPANTSGMPYSWAPCRAHSGKRVSSMVTNDSALLASRIQCMNTALRQAAHRTWPNSALVCSRRDLPHRHSAAQGRRRCVR